LGYSSRKLEFWDSGLKTFDVGAEIW
jgi:hypothetical protein